MEDVMMVMREGEKNRTVACTKMNTNRWGRVCVDLNIYLAVAYTLLLYFFNQTPWLIFFFAVRFSAATIQGWLIFEGAAFILLRSRWIAMTTE